MHIEVLSLFPKYIEGPLQESILKRAIANGHLRVSSTDIRDFSTRSDRRVDDRPFGGGPGMVMMAEPTVAAIRASRTPSSKVVYLSPQGKPLTPDLAKELALVPHLILLCGHYEGIDQRAIDSDVDLEVSIGDYVLTNGCLAALVLIDVVARFIPGVLGHEAAASEDSFEHGIFDHPHYTHPVVFEEKAVPEVLLTGDHKKISLWRHEQALARTVSRRADLVAKAYLSPFVSSETTVALRQIVEPTSEFEETCRFYEKVLGIAPRIDDVLQKADFTLNGLTLTLVRSNGALSKRTLAFQLPPEQLRRAVSWTRRKGINVGYEGEIIVLNLKL